MSRASKIVDLAKAWSDKIGKEAAVMRLIKRKLSISTAEKICSGRYGAELRSYNAEALLKEMAKDGFVLADDAS